MKPENISADLDGWMDGWMDVLDYFKSVMTVGDESDLFIVDKIDE